MPSSRQSPGSELRCRAPGRVDDLSRIDQAVLAVSGDRAWGNGECSDRCRRDRWTAGSRATGRGGPHPRIAVRKRKHCTGRDSTDDDHGSQAGDETPHDGDPPRLPVYISLIHDNSQRLLDGYGESPDSHLGGVRCLNWSSWHSQIADTSRRGTSVPVIEKGECSVASGSPIGQVGLVRGM